MTKKVPKKMLRIERNFLVNLRKKCFSRPRPPRRFFGTGGAPPPLTEIDRRAAADTMTSAHSSTMQYNIHYNIVCSIIYSICTFYNILNQAKTHDLESVWPVGCSLCRFWQRSCYS